MKSKKLLFVIIPVCLAVITAIVLLLLFATGAFLSPKARVMLALSRAFGSGSVISEYSGNTNVSDYGYAPEYLVELLKLSDTAASIKERGYSIDSSFALTDIDTAEDIGLDSLSGTGFHVTGDIDPINRIAYYDLVLQYNFLKVSLGEYYIDDASISMELPSYFEGYLFLPTETLGTSYNASIFPSLLGFEIPQELESSVSFSAFDLLCGPTADEDTYIDSEDTLSVLKDFYDAIEVEKTGETKSILIGSKQQDCDEYLITLDEDAVLSLIESYEDWYFSSNQETLDKYETYYSYLAGLDDSGIDPSSTLREQIEKVFDGYKELLATDHEIYVYLDNKNRLAAASYQNELDTSGLCDLLDSEITDSLDEVIDEYYDSYNDYKYYGVYDALLDDYSNYDYDDDANLEDSPDTAGASDMPGTCEVSAEIIFHGRDYLPERYEGSLLFALDNEMSCEIGFTGENRTDTGDMLHSTLNALLTLTNGDETTRYDVSYSTSYQMEDKNLIVEMAATDENNIDVLEISLDSTATVEDDTLEFDIEKLTLTTRSESGENSVGITADTSLSPLSDRVPIPEGRVRNLLIMSEGDYEMLFDEIFDSLW